MKSIKGSFTYATTFPVTDYQLQSTTFHPEFVCGKPMATGFTNKHLSVTSSLKVLCKMLSALQQNVSTYQQARNQLMSAGKCEVSKRLSDKQ